MLIPVSVGEVIDKVTILEIKKEKIVDSVKLANVCTELNELKNVLQSHELAFDELPVLIADLLHINKVLWNIEDDIRECERQKSFGSRFVDLARSVYRSNDERSRIKRKINELTGSVIVEEKAYKLYN
jgi:type II secretory pathway predicted ATPase ExeA